jgi:pyruvate dehydrogenase (quinone)
MSNTVGDHFVRRLLEWGVTRIYGYPGDGINGILGALDRAGNRPEFIQVPHEELSSFMACAHAKFTGEVGVCLATAGPGAIHLLNGLYDARLDHQPVVAIVGQQPSKALGGRYMQEIDLTSLYKDVASAYVQMVTSPDQVRHALDRAFRIAASERTVTCLIVPNDLQREDAVEAPPHEHATMHSGVGYRPPRVVPYDDDLRHAADVLNAGRKVAILAGAGALAATEEVVEVAERLGAGVAKALLGKAAVPDDLPFVTGSAGWLGTAASNDMLAECDTLLMIGSGFPYTEFLPKEGQARGVQIDVNPAVQSLRYPMEVGLVGDSAETLRALIPLLEQKADRSWRQQIEANVADWWREVEEDAMRDGDPLNPRRVFWELSARLPDDCILTGDCGSSTVWYARYLRVRRGMMASLSGTLATMGSAVPYAVAAKFAHPGRPVVATVGDGAMQMSGINGLISVARFWERWDDPRLVVVVMNNRDLNYVTWEQRILEGHRKFEASQLLPDVPYARYAELLGLAGARLERAEDVGRVLDEAMAADRPFVVDAVVDPDAPPLPPELKPEQAEKLRAALSEGDPDADDVMRQLKAEGLL